MTWFHKFRYATEVKSSYVFNDSGAIFQIEFHRFRIVRPANNYLNVETKSKQNLFTAKLVNFEVK